jgi:hypothetical protein
VWQKTVQHLDTAAIIGADEVLEPPEGREGHRQRSASLLMFVPSRRR